MEFSQGRSPIRFQGKHIRFRSSSPSTSSANPPPSKRHKVVSESTIITQTSTKRRHITTSRYKHTRRKSSRKWVFTSHASSSHLRDEIVVVSYNILGVENAENHPDLYYKVLPQYLDWEWRKMCIREELHCYKASILCLQEVDRFPDLADLLKEDGFNGIYKARTGEACDGCAIFWREDLFTLIHQESIEFSEFDLRDNVAQFCVLKMKSNNLLNNSNAQISRNRTLVVGNIHVLYNPKRGDIKIGQIRLFIKKAHKLSKKWGNVPLVLGGDINSTPQSAIYKFLASSELDLLQHNRRELSGQIEPPPRWRFLRAHTEDPSRCHDSWSEEELQLAAGREGTTYIQHHLQLHSAYVGVPGSYITRDRHGEPLATTYHSNFMGTVDYIWHSKDLVPVGVVEILPIDVLKRMRGLPSEEWGSDHLALVCKLAFADEPLDSK